MTSPNSIGQPVAVPRFVAALEAFARSHGMHVAPAERDASIGAEGRYPSLERLVGEWRGTRAQFLALGLALPSWSFPLGSNVKALTVGTCAPIAAGDVYLDGDVVVFRPDLGELPRSVAHVGPVERVDYGHESIGYHGTAEDLVATGICAPDQVKATPTRNWTSSATRRRWAGDHDWHAKRQPDGRWWFTRWTAATLARREFDQVEQWRDTFRATHGAEALRQREAYYARECGYIAPQRPRPALRLVVDNARA